MSGRCFDFFRTHTVRDLAGYYEGPLWARLVLQASHCELAVRSAIVALGALQANIHLRQSLELPGVDNVRIDVDFPLRQYTKALGGLRRLLSSKDERWLELALICSLVCIYFDTLRREHAQALAHLESSLKVLCMPAATHASPVSSHAADASQIDHDLVQAFVRLDVQASSYFTTRAPTISNVSSIPEIPIRFSSVSAARDQLNSQLHTLHAFFRTTADRYRHDTPDGFLFTAIAEMHVLRERLHRWSRSFKALLDRPTLKLSRREQTGVILLQIEHQMATIKLETCLYPEESIFDNFDAAFDRIVSLVAYVLHSRELVDHHSPCSELSLDTGVVQPLYYTACKCRLAVTRDRAIALLASIPGSEGVWDGFVMAKIAERIKTIEEEATLPSTLSTERVPEFARVHFAVIDQYQYPVRLMCRQRLNGVNGGWNDRIDWITW